MEELLIAKAELENELKDAQSLDTSAETERKIAEYKAELEARAEADKQNLIVEKQEDLRILNRVIANRIAKTKAESEKLTQQTVPLEIKQEE